MRIAQLLLAGDRLRRLRELDDAIVVHDLRRGIPFGDGTVDAVYLSHLLEHVDRPSVGGFLEQIRRVLRTGGVVRVVVPDLEVLCRNYLDHLETCAGTGSGCEAHDGYVAAMIEQMVRREALGTSRQRPLRRAMENLLLGDAQRRGETHLWMYDRVNLRHVLAGGGFRKIEVKSFDSSLIPEWDQIALDRDADGGEYKPGSLYIEAVR